MIRRPSLPPHDPTAARPSLHRAALHATRATLMLSLLAASACDIPVTGGEDCGCPVNVPPVAMASATPDMGAAPLEVDFSAAGSSDEDGTIASYAWDFGDGESSIAENPTHTFDAPGTYTVTLVVTDERGGTGTTTVTVTVTTVDGNIPPVAVASATPDSGEAPVDVVFSSVGSSDADGTIVSYAWDFGDGGASTDPNPTHPYASEGTYDVTLTVTDDEGATGTAVVTVTITAPPAPNAPPTAVIVITPTGVTGEEVFYDGSGSSDSDGAIVSYEWDFGDGRTATVATPDWVYDVEDTYTVTLTVTDDEGATDTATMDYVVTDNPLGRYVGVDGADAGNDCASSLNKCLTINYAISQADAGDTVYVSPGTYDEVVDPSKALTFKGKNVGVNSGPTDTEERRPETIVKAFRNAGDSTVYLDFELNGFMIDPGGDGALFAGGLGIVNLFGGPSVVIVNNFFRGAPAFVPDCGYVCGTMGDYGLRIHAGGAEVRDNRFESWRRALDIRNSSSAFPILAGSSIRNNAYVGITGRAMSVSPTTDRTEGMPGIVIEGNLVDATGYEALSAPAGLTVANHSNDISNNTFIGLDRGIDLQICKKFITNDNEIVGNTFVDNVGSLKISTVGDGSECDSLTTEGGYHWPVGGGRVEGLVVTGNSFTGSVDYAILFNPDWDPYLEVITAGDIDATCNWYGDAAGPSDPSMPGDRVMQGPADNAQVIYTPWLTAEGGACDGGL